jgi:hypothetical protein
MRLRGLRDMWILVSVSSRKHKDLARCFSWPDDVSLVIPREGEYADFVGSEPRLVRRVTYAYELVRDAEAELLQLVIHIETA